MGLFDKFKNPEVQEIAAEGRQMNYTRETEILRNATSPQDDQVYLEQQQIKTELLRWQQDLNDEVLSLVMTLKGFAMTENKEWIKVMEKPLCNDLFIYEVIMPQVSPFVSRNRINSNFQEERILRDLKFTMNDIATAMVFNHTRYEIAFQNYNLVDRLIKNTIAPGSFRSIGGWNKKQDNTVIKVVQSSHEGNPIEKKKSLFG